jgi:hypothetical protein
LLETIAGNKQPAEEQILFQYMRHCQKAEEKFGH